MKEVPITSEQYLTAYVAGTCINCNKEINCWEKFLRLFWAPLFCQTSILWKVVCSYKCWGEILEREVANLQEEDKRIE